MSIIRIQTPLTQDAINSLRVEDHVRLSGEVLVFRDQVHRILFEFIEKGEKLPFGLKDQAVYYCGPTPPKGGRPVGSAGPTTSSRMDRFTPSLLDLGLKMMIGKGNRSPEVIEAIKKYKAAYMVAIGGVGALLARHIIESRVIAFPELGTEAARIFTFNDFPLIVGIDSTGKSAFV
jgi:fumarate hydratase subunit beta